MSRDSNQTSAPQWISADEPSIQDLWILNGGLEAFLINLVKAIDITAEDDEALDAPVRLRGTLQ